MKNRKKSKDIKKNFEGSMVALVTPFTKDLTLDEKALKRLLDFHLERRTDVIIPCGTTGESPTLSHEEHRRIMSFVIEYVNGKVPVVCGAGSNCTSEGLGLVKYAEKAGADGVLIVTPYYNRPTQEGLFRHYLTLASAVDIPVILYNVPGRTGVSIAPETVARLAEIPNIVAIKEASGNLAQVDRILQLCDITVLSGDDALTLPILAIGGRGVISVTANVVPHLIRDMVHSALGGNFEKAREIHQELHALSDVMFVETNPIPVKTALDMMGMIRFGVRLPLCEMKKENQGKLRKVLTELGVLE